MDLTNSSCDIRDLGNRVGCMQLFETIFPMKTYESGDVLLVKFYMAYSDIDLLDSMSMKPESGIEV